MAYRETTVRFEDEIKRLEAEREELLDEAADLSEDHPQYAAKVNEGEAIDNYLDGLDWAADEALGDDEVPAWDEDVDSITLSGLNTGGVAQVKAKLKEAGESSDFPAEVAANVFQVVAATVEAPYLDDGMGTMEQVAAVASLPPGFTSYASDKVEELSSVGGNERKSFSESLAERRSE